MTDLSNFTSVFSSHTDGRVAKRNRRPVSCSTCRLRKSKCDRQHPCGYCSSKGEAATCNYSSVPSRKDTRPRNAPHSDAATRLQKLEALVNGLMTSNTSTVSVLTPPGSSVSPENESPDYSDVSAGGHLTRQGSQVNYIGGTHWASILESIHDIRSVLDYDDNGSHLDVAPLAPTKADPLFGQQKLLTIDQVLAMLPPRPIVDGLVASYFKEPFLSLVFVHSGKFKREYETFWRNPSSTSFLWLSILFSIIFMSSKLAKARSLEAPSTPCDTKRDGALRTAAECLVTGQYLRAQPYSVEALLFHFHCIYALHADPDIQPWPILTMATRLAQKMGYHRDPKHLSVRMSPFESELRRRAWYYIEVFDLTMSTQQGIPTMINEEECDCQSPVNLLDEDFDEDTAVMPPPRSDTSHTYMLFFVFKSAVVRRIRPIIRHALSSRRYNLEETNRLHEEFEALHQRTPPCLRIRTLSSTSFVDQDYLIMQRVMLELQYLKGLCILHRPFMTYEKNNPAFEHFREVCRSAALRGLDLQADYYQALQPGGRLYDSRWMFTNITMHEMFSAAMIVCLDLSEYKSQSKASRERKLEALRTSHQVWSSKRPVYKDAIRASHVLSVMIAKLTDQEAETPGMSIGHGQNLHNPAQLTFATAAFSDANNAASQSGFMQSQDTSYDFMDIGSLEDMLENPTMLNWNDIDNYLIDYSAGFDYSNQQQSGAPFQAA